MLGEIATLLGRFPEVKEFAAVRYLDLDSLTRTIWEVSEKAGMAKHTGGFSAPAAINLKKTWLGGGVFGRGIFAQLVPPVCSP
jgi:hypothetical protein